MYQSIDVLGFEKYFPNEESCKEYLMKQRWPEGFVCPRCGGKKAGFHRARRLYQCKSCRYQVSLTAGTIFHKTRMPLKKWFWLIFLLSRSKQGISMKAIQRILGVGSYETVWRMTHKVRAAMAKRDANYKLAGLIELDESYFGKRSGGGKRGRGAPGKRAVMVALSTTPEGNPDFLRMKVMKSVNSTQTHLVLKEIVKPGETLKTDGFLIYSPLTRMGFQHRLEFQEDPRKTRSLLPWLHTIVSNAKRFLQGAHYHEAPRHLQRFLDEFCYRFNRRRKESELFDRLLTACVTATAVTYAELKG